MAAHSPLGSISPIKSYQSKVGVIPVGVLCLGGSTLCTSRCRFSFVKPTYSTKTGLAISVQTGLLRFRHQPLSTTAGCRRSDMRRGRGATELYHFPWGSRNTLRHRLVPENGLSICPDKCVKSPPTPHSPLVLVRADLSLRKPERRVPSMVIDYRWLPDT